MNYIELIKALPGPILIVGASGFVGANILHTFLQIRSDVFGSIFSGDSWRLKNVSSQNIIFLNLQSRLSVQTVLNRIKPKVIFDCSSFGAYSFEDNYERIHAINYTSFINMMELVAPMDLHAYIHAGSSSEYGTNAAGPAESDILLPNSHYAVSKASATQAISYYGKIRQIPVINLRLYSVYGAYEDSSRLIPVLCEKADHDELPVFTNPEVSRDFIYIEDAVEAFIVSASSIHPNIFGESFNIGSGTNTKLKDLAFMAKKIFSVSSEPVFNTSVGRAWDVENWYANTTKAEKLLGWKANTSLEQGLKLTKDWWDKALKEHAFLSLTKKKQLTKNKNSFTAIVACYKDEQAIPVMYERIVAVANKLAVDYQIIFVNDCSPDNSTAVISKISEQDPNVIGIIHSRNFGSQAAFKSGMEIANKEACVLLDGDLQDPPELIEKFVIEWRNGADIVYGRRIKREMPAWLEFCYKLFYQIFAMLSDITIPKDAGDFSLIDNKAVYWLLQCRERDLFLRGLRAFIGFKQVGVDYVRPERMFGLSTNNWIKNIGWAKKGIFSFTRVPLHLLTAFGAISFLLTACLAIYSIFIRLVLPELVPRGITFLSLIVMIFGSSTILGIGLLGEYIGKIFEETKARPAFIRKNLILGGQLIDAEDKKI